MKDFWNINVIAFKWYRISIYSSSGSQPVASSSELKEGTAISELAGYVGRSASNVEVDAAENARGVI